MPDLKRIFPVVMLVFLIIACSLTAGCASPAKSPASVQSISSPGAIGSNSTAERIEVYHFHGNTQCTSCIAVGDLAEKTVKANFNDELASGHLVFAHVNYDLPENEDLATHYGVTGSSLWIGVYDADGFHKEQDIRVWYLIDDENAYSTHLSGIITKRLNRDFS